MEGRRVLCDIIQSEKVKSFSSPQWLLDRTFSTLAAKTEPLSTSTESYNRHIVDQEEVVVCCGSSQFNKGLKRSK